MDWWMTLTLLSVVVAGGFLGSGLGSRYWKAETIRRMTSLVLILGGAKLMVDYVGLMS